MKEDSTVAEEIDGAIAYAKRFAIIPGSTGAFFVNGKYHDFDDVRNFVCTEAQAGFEIHYLALFRLVVLSPSATAVDTNDCMMIS